MTPLGESPEVFRAVAIAAGLLVGGLVAGLRRWKRQVDLEDAEALLRAEFDGDDLVRAPRDTPHR
jgi:hypothetical protein